MRNNNALIGDERTTFYQPATFLGFAIIWQRQEVITEAFQKHAVTGFKNEIKPTKNYTIEQKSLISTASVSGILYTIPSDRVCVFTGHPAPSPGAFG